MERAAAAERDAAAKRDAAAREAERQRAAAASVAKARERTARPKLEVAPAPPPQTREEPEQEPEPEPEPVEPPPPALLRPAAPRQWNLWELEAIARRRGEVTEVQDLMLLHLRPYASPEGILPADFDDLVRETFGGLLADRA